MYLQYYNLREKPFQISPDPRYFFGSSPHKRALAYLRYGVAQGEGFIVITGDVGTGKSTLVRVLLDEVQRKNIVAAQIVTTQVQADDLLRIIAAQFGLEYDNVSKAALLQKLEQFFVACAREGRRALMIVDEAQNLPDRSVEELRMLSNFQFNGRSLVQSFLLGQKEFRRTMRSAGFEQLRQRVIAAYHLRPLELAETQAYIEHRLRMAGWAGNPSFTDAAFERIFQFTAGVPRRINTLCDRILLYGALEQVKEINPDVVRLVTDDIGQEFGSVDAGEGSSLQRERNTHRRDELDTSDLTNPSLDPSVVSINERRLRTLESAVVGMSQALREELAMLRRALKENTQSGKSDEHEGTGTK